MQGAMQAVRACRSLVLTARVYAARPERGKLSARTMRFATAALLVLGACEGRVEATDAGAMTDAGPPEAAGTDAGATDALVCLGASGADPDANVASQTVYFGGGIICSCGVGEGSHGICLCGGDISGGVFLGCPCCPSEEEAVRICDGPWDAGPG